MYRVIKMGIKVFAMEVDLTRTEIENIEEFVESGDVVMLAYNLELVADFLDIEEDQIEIVEPE